MSTKKFRSQGDGERPENHRYARTFENSAHVNNHLLTQHPPPAHVEVRIVAGNPLQANHKGLGVAKGKQQEEV